MSALNIISMHRIFVHINFRRGNATRNGTIVYTTRNFKMFIGEREVRQAKFLKFFISSITNMV